MIEEVTRMIASVRGHNVDRCNDKCQCRPLAVKIVSLLERHHADDRNALAEKLYEAKDELMRLRAFVGEV